MNFAGLILIGICIGIANIIPGVSGGTLAVVFNIYDRFINCITLNIKKLWAEKWFIISLGLGMAAGVLLWLSVVRKQQLHRPCGIMMLAGYGIYLSYLLIK